MTRTELINLLLPLLGRSTDVPFNVFDVMHHGTHEKQLSNVFAWLLDIGETHGFEELGQRLFVELVNETRSPDDRLSKAPYRISQEEPTTGAGEEGDIADIVLEGDTARIVVENYRTSDGHGHGYGNYLRLAGQDGKTPAVVMLCAEEDRTLLADGWEKASVVTYEAFLDRLLSELDRDPKYANRNPDQYSFIRQMHRKYASGEERVGDRELLDFVTAMCATGEARHYQTQRHTVAAEQFANDMAQQARQRFEEGRGFLNHLRDRLWGYADTVLREQLNTSLGAVFITGVRANFAGIYQWSINFDTDEDDGPYEEARLQIKFGPSAWFANEPDRYWKKTVPPESADYSHLFLTRVRNREVRQSSVTMQEVLDGLSPDDTRLHDEIMALLRET